MRCILVLGLESSGTSCVAGVLHNLGCNMGERFPGPNAGNPKGHFEDVSFAEIMDDLYGRDYEDALRKWIDSRNCRGNEVWGVKNPLLYIVGKKVLDFFEKYYADIDLKIVAVMRHPAAIVKSQQKKRPVNIAEKVRFNVYSSFDKYLKFLGKLAIPVHFCFFDWLIDNKIITIVQLRNFCFSDCNYKPNIFQIKRAAEFVEPDLRHWK